MYKIIIADDEKPSRNGFSFYTKKMDGCFEVVQTFEDGKETIDYLKSNDVDIVITDIRMDEVSGLEVAKYVYENKPDTKVIIVSAYKDFEYAHAALEYKVSKFLIKPVTFEDFSDALYRVADELSPSYRNTCDYFIRNTQGDIPQQLKDKFTPRTRSCTITFLTDSFCDIIENKWSYGKEGFVQLLNNFLNDCNNAAGTEYHFLGHSNDKIEFIAYSDVFEDDEEFKRNIALCADKVKIMLAEVFEQKNEEMLPPKTDTDILKSSAVVERTKKYIEDHYNEEISLYDLGMYFNVNSAYLCRIFKQYAGMGFSEYLTHIRIENAKKIILKGGYKVEDVARKVGYPYASYFSRVFKNSTGYSPKEFYIKKAVKDDEK